jgi:hypothetical protein
VGITRRLTPWLIALSLVAFTVAPALAERAGKRQTIIEQYVYAPGGRLGAICGDGWRSFSTGRGTCSHHGGVARWIMSELQTRSITPTFLSRHVKAFSWAQIIMMMIDIPAGLALWAMFIESRESSGNPIASQLVSQGPSMPLPSSKVRSPRRRPARRRRAAPRPPRLF